MIDPGALVRVKTVSHIYPESGNGIKFASPHGEVFVCIYVGGEARREVNGPSAEDYLRNLGWECSDKLSRDEMKKFKIRQAEARERILGENI